LGDAAVTHDHDRKGSQAHETCAAVLGLLHEVLALAGHDFSNREVARTFGRDSWAVFQKDCAGIPATVNDTPLKAAALLVPFSKDFPDQGASVSELIPREVREEMVFRMQVEV
jgi:hypothetical protein